MTIGELSRTTGIAASAIRYYEEQGLLPAASRASGRRVFEDDAVARLTFIQVATAAGFSLAEVRQLIGDFKGDRWRRLAERKIGEIDEQIARLRTMQEILRRLAPCGCFDVEACGTVLYRDRKRRNR